MNGSSSKSLVTSTMAGEGFLKALRAAEEQHAIFEDVDDSSANALADVADAKDPSSRRGALDEFTRTLAESNLAMRRELNLREDLLGAAGIWADDLFAEEQTAAEDLQEAA
jgi:hypothetical protein